MSSPTPTSSAKQPSAPRPKSATTKTAPSHKRTSSQAGNTSSPSPTPAASSSDLDPMDIVTDDLTPAAREAQALLTSRPKRRRRSAGQSGSGSGSTHLDDDGHSDNALLAGTLLPKPADGDSTVADSTTSMASASTLTPEEKKRIRMMKNRLAASESRKRHREHLDTLESTTHQLVAENARLVAALRESQAQCAQLAGQVAKLTATLELAQQDSKVKSFGAVFALAMVGVAWLVPVMWTSPVPPGVGLVVRPGAREPAQANSKWGAPVGGVKWNGAAAGGQVLRTLGGQWHMADPGSEMVPAAKHAGTLAGRVRAAARAVQWSITGKRTHEVPRLPEGPSSSAVSSTPATANVEATKVVQQGVRVQAGPWASGAVALLDATAAGHQDGVRPLVVANGFVDEDDDVAVVPGFQTLVNDQGSDQ